MATKKQELVHGCFADAHDGEPLFVLRSTDPRAPAVVREWARLYLANRVRALRDPGEGAPEEARAAYEAELARREAKYVEASELADRMDAYRLALEGAEASGTDPQGCREIAARAVAP